MSRRTVIWIASALLTFTSFSLRAQDRKKPAAAPIPGDFFIVSSVDLSKRELLLKLPTEVTEVMRADDHTRILEANGKPIKLADLRAGDTVYITSARDPKGPLALQIRKGFMTVDELHRRYYRAVK